jgi:hypothetical protein
MIPTTNEIEGFLHCAQCLKEKPPDVSPRDWAQLEAGWTRIGLQIWCKRHEKNVMHIDFEGRRHPACTSTSEEN